MFFTAFFFTSSFSQINTSQVTPLCEVPSQYDYSNLNCVNGEVFFHFSPDDNYINVHLFLVEITGAFTCTVYGPFETLTEGVDLINNNSANIIDDQDVSDYYNYSINFIKDKVYILKIYKRECVGTIGFSRDGNNIYACDEIPCENCIPKFNPPLGKYIISAWVKEENAPRTKTSYTTPTVEVNFSSINLTLSFSPGGPIIDGWQKIESVINITTIGDFEMRLKVSSGEAYFDDIRLFPYDGSMITYVYDPLNLRLVAELDERNYAKIYEYDEEGKLIRVKKETEKGIMTIQETRENSFK